MFIFARNTKEIVVTAGSVVACLAFLLLAARCIYLGGFRWVIAIACVLIVLAICKGVMFGYQLARALFCFFVFATGTFAVNPFTYDDFLGNNDAYWAFLLKSSLFVAIGIIAFLSLGEHAKLRNLK